MPEAGAVEPRSLQLSANDQPSSGPAAEDTDDVGDDIVTVRLTRMRGQQFPPGRSGFQFVVTSCCRSYGRLTVRRRHDVPMPAECLQTDAYRRM